MMFAFSMLECNVLPYPWFKNNNNNKILNVIVVFIITLFTFYCIEINCCLQNNRIMTSKYFYTKLFSKLRFGVMLVVKKNITAVKISFFPRQLYSFGETVSIVFWDDSWKPESFYDKICVNLERGLHTLCLLGKLTEH